MRAPAAGREACRHPLASLAASLTAVRRVPEMHQHACVHAIACRRGVAKSTMEGREQPPYHSSKAAARVNPAAMPPQPQPVSPPAQQQPALPLPEQQLPPQQQEGTALPAAAKPPPACRVPGCTEPLVNIYNQVRLPPGCWSSARAQDGAPVFLSPAREPRQRLRRVPNLWEA